MKPEPTILAARRLRTAQLAVTALLLFLAARAAWHASRTKTGWEVIRHDWGRTLANWMQIDKPALAEREPAEQARVWLKEVDRLQGQKWSPRAAAGAAWLLDAPQAGFLQHHFRANKATQGISGLPLQAHVKLDDIGVARAVDEFEDLCHERCAELIEYATRAEPENVNLWRTRVLLLFRSDLLGLGFEPRQVDWLPILEECARHDADNALYDYLAALAEWKSAADHRWEEAGYVLEVRDEEGYERGNRRFAAGLEKPRLMFGSSGCLDALSFLESSSLLHFDRLKAAASCPLGAWANKMPYSLLRWQDNQQSAQRRKGEFAAASGTLRDTLRVARQLSATGNPPGLLTEPLILRRFALANLAKLADDAPGLFDPDEVPRIEEERRDIRLQLAVLDKVGERMKAREHAGWSIADVAAITLAGFVQPVAETMLPLAVVLAMVARLCSNRATRPVERVGFFACVLTLAAGLGWSYAIFGLCPAEIVSVHVQTRVVRIAIVVPIALALLGAFFVLNRKFRVGFSQLLALAVTFALPWASLLYWAEVPDLLLTIVAGLPPLATLLLPFALVGAAWWLLKTDAAFLRRRDVPGRDKMWLLFFAQVLAASTVPWGPMIGEFADTHLATQCWVPPRVWNEARAIGITPSDLASGTTRHPWLTSLLQWHTYHGLWCGLVLSLFLLTATVLLRLKRSVAGGFRGVVRHGKITCLRQIATTVARFLVLAGTFAMVAYLTAVPAVIEEREAYYERHLSRLVDPESARKEIEAEIATIRSDPAIMAEVHQRSAMW